MSYAQLQTDLANWHHRGDLSSHVSTFVRLSEIRFNAFLYVRQREAEFASTAISNGAISLPADFDSFKYLKSGNYTLEAKTAEFVRNQPTSAQQPKYYAIDGDEVIFWPTSGDVEGVYYATIPGLEASSTNWLDDYRSDLYLYACLHQAYLFMKNTAKAQEYYNLSAEIMREIVSKDRAESISGSPMVQRARR